MENQRRSLDQVGGRLGVKGADLSPWYKATLRQLLSFGLGGLLIGRYQGSIYEMLSNVYPDYNWIPWNFDNLPRSIGLKLDVLNMALDFVDTSLKIDKPEMWYRVSKSQLKSLGINQIIAINGGLHPSLVRARPNFAWEESLFIGFRPKKTLSKE